MAPQLQETWGRALAQLGEQVGQAEVDNWLSDAALLECGTELARLAVPSRLHQDWIRRRYLGSLCGALAVERVELSIQDSPAPPPEPPSAPSETASRPLPEAPPPATAYLADETENTPLVLNSDYTFEYYVVGPCNRFAHAAAQGVVDRPAAAFNPLFLHGSVGLGKTHLMQAIAHCFVSGSHGTKVAFLSCEQFVNHFIHALQQGNLETFRQRYRKVDVLVVDDIQVLANKARTQEEFFHTFNTLHNAKRQIVLSSDSPPEEIPSLQERLVSRFQWGLVAEIEPPCFETRVAILQAKAERSGLQLGEDVAKFVAENIVSNIRELEGTLTNIHAMATLTNRPVDMGLARQVLGPNQRVRNRIVRIDDILVAVTNRFGVKVSDLQSKRRTQSIVQPRQLAMYLARQMTPLSLEEIGGYFGGRDHTTVLYAIDKIESRRRVDQDFTILVSDLEREVRTKHHD